MISCWCPETLALQVTPALLEAAVEAAKAQKLSRFDSRGTSWTSYLKLVNLLMNHLPATSWNVPMHAQTLL